MAIFVVFVRSHGEILVFPSCHCCVSCVVMVFVVRSHGETLCFACVVMVKLSNVGSI
jgi:hypothetical protein